MDPAIAYDPAIAPLGVYPKELKAGLKTKQNISTYVFQSSSWRGT